MPGNAIGGTFQRRVLYATIGVSIPEDNYETAVQAQGPDLYTKRDWCDKE